MIQPFMRDVDEKYRLFEGDLRSIQIGENKVIRQFLAESAHVRYLHRSDVVAIELQKDIEVGLRFGGMLHAHLRLGCEAHDRHPGTPIGYPGSIEVSLVLEHSLAWLMPPGKRWARWACSAVRPQGFDRRADHSISHGGSRLQTLLAWREFMRDQTRSRLPSSRQDISRLGVGLVFFASASFDQDRANQAISRPPITLKRMARL
jgi:hypothetical protein